MKEINQNIAPIAPLEASYERKSSQGGTYLSDGLRELFSDFLERDKEIWEEIARTSEITSNFIQGKQIWAKNYWTNEWRVVPIQRADPNKVSSINIMQFYCTSQLKMITSSNPDLEPEDSYPDRTYKRKILANKAVWNRYESKFYGKWFNSQQALHMIISGTYLESVRYNELLPGPVAIKDIFSNVRVKTSPGGSACLSCGFEGEYGDFVKDEQMPIGQCPECQSTEVLPPQKPEFSDYNTFSGTERVNKGDLELRLLPIQTVRFDTKLQVEKSSWMLERIVVPRSRLMYILENEQLVNESIAEDAGLRSLDSIQRAGNTLGGAQSQYYRKNTDPIVERLSVRAEDVHHIILKKDERTVSGTVLPAGSRLSDHCIDGVMTILATAGGKHILGIYPGIHHSKEVASGVYHMRYESGLGRASEDTVEVQKRFNRFDAQNTKYLEVSATPAHTYIKGAVDEEYIKHIGHPAKAIPINKEVAMAMGSMDLVRAIPPSTMSAQFFSYTYDILNQYRQLTSHSTDFTNAFPGVNNTTATGARLAKSNADSVFSPVLGVKAEARCVTAANTIGLYRDNFSDVRVYHKISKNDSKRSYGEFISGSEVDPKIPFVVVRDSEQPRTMYDRQMDFMNMMSVANQGGGWQVLKEADPKIVDALTKVFDIDIGDNDYDTISTVNDQRIEEALDQFRAMKQVQAIMAKAGAQPFQMDPESIFQNLSNPIILEESNHMKKATWYMEYIDSPDGQKLDREEKQIIAGFVRLHFQMEVAQQTAIAQGFMEAQGIDPDEAQNARDHEAEMADANMQAQAMEKEVELARDEQGREHELTRMKLDHEQKKEQLALQSAMKIREAKAAPKQPVKTK